MEILVGKVVHYYSHLSVAVLELFNQLNVGDRIAILGHTTDLTQTVTSLEQEHNKINSASTGDLVAMQVWDYVREGDLVYKILDNSQLQNN